MKLLIFFHLKNHLKGNRTKNKKIEQINQMRNKEGKMQLDIPKFVMKYYDSSRYKILYIPNNCVSKKGVFVKFIGPLKDKQYKKILKDPKYSDIRSIVLKYDKLYKKYYIHVSFGVISVGYFGRKKIIALDPGELHFQTGYGLDECITMGSYMRSIILHLKNKSNKYDKVLKLGVNRHGKPLRNKKNIKIKKARCEDRIKNLVKDMHRKIILYLCENYETILLPSFNTQKMIKNTKSEMAKNTIKNIKDPEVQNQKKE